MKRKNRWRKQPVRPGPHHRCRKCRNYYDNIDRCLYKARCVPDGQECELEDLRPGEVIGQIKEIYFIPLQSKNPST